MNDTIPPPDFNYAPHQIRAGQKSPYRIAMGYETEDDLENSTKGRTRKLKLLGDALLTALILVALWGITACSVILLVLATIAGLS